MSMIGWLTPIEKPGSCCRRALSRRRNILPGLALWPGVVGLQADGRFDVGRRPWIGAVIVAAELGDGIGYLGKFPQRAAAARPPSRWPFRSEIPEGNCTCSHKAPFVQLGQKFAAGGHAENHHGDQGCHRLR